MSVYQLPQPGAVERALPVGNDRSTLSRTIEDAGHVQTHPPVRYI